MLGDPKVTLQEDDFGFDIGALDDTGPRGLSKNSVAQPCGLVLVASSEVPGDEGAGTQHVQVVCPDFPDATLIFRPFGFYNLAGQQFCGAGSFRVICRRLCSKTSCGHLMRD